MPLYSKLLSSLTEEDLISLCDNKVPEDKTIEYKKTLPEGSEGAKKEFLNDVSSFANTQGGLIVYGMEEVGGLPIGLIGIAAINEDKERLRLEEILRDGIRPAISGLEMRFFDLENGNTAIVIRVPRSWNLPHQVTYQKSFRFYARHSNGKYLLDVDELRSVFAMSGAIADRMRGFRSDRIAKIGSGKAPVILSDQPILVIHLAPFSMFDSSSTFSFDKATRSHDQFPPIRSETSPYHQITFDGLLTALSPTRHAQRAYVQVFRYGAVEAVFSLGDPMVLPQIHEAIIWGADRYVRALNGLGVEPPIAVMFSIINVGGRNLLPDFSVSPFYHDSTRLSEDQFHFVETIFNSIPIDYKNTAYMLRASLDHVANLAGLAASPRFDLDGNYTNRNLD